MYISDQFVTKRVARQMGGSDMAIYRYQVVSVGLWRGKIKRWNTTFHAPTSGYTASLYSAMQKAGYPAPGDATGACSGGVASIAVYASTGGAPISRTTYFDWETPTTWIPYTGTAWAAVDPTTPLDAAGESAAIIVGNLPGLSVTGKPMSTRKYLHAVPSRTGPTYEDPDIPSAAQAALAAAFPAYLMSSPSGVSPSTVECLQYYGNHQRVRGRRRTTNQVAAQAFSLGVLAGGGATTSGQGDPFPGGEY